VLLVMAHWMACAWVMVAALQDQVRLALGGEEAIDR
jgi:hypothetical protein